MLSMSKNKHDSAVGWLLSYSIEPTKNLRWHEIAVNPDSIILDQRIRRATCNLARLWNPGPILLKGPAPHPFYINAEVLNVDSGMQEAYHYNRCHHSADWI